MRFWSLRVKMTAFVVGLVTGGVLISSAVHEWFAFQALNEDVRTRAAGIASQLAFGISAQELGDRTLLALEIRNILAARPTLRWLEVYAAGPTGLRPVASSQDSLPDRPPDLAVRAVTEGRTLSAPGVRTGGDVWLAATPITLNGATAGAVVLALSQEGAQRMAASLRQQLLVVLVVAGVAIVAGLALFSERNINRPIRALLETMRVVERGDLSATPTLQRQDEMGQLARGLARMLHRVREGHGENARLLAQINRFNQDLQGQVAEATRELVERNEALRHANELLFDLQRQLGRAQRLATLGHLTARIAHEIGTPLNSVAVHLQLLERSQGLTDQDRRRLVTIDGQIQRLVATIHGLLTATRGTAPHLEPTDLNAVVQGVTDLMAPVLAAKDIECAFSAFPGLPPVRANGHQVQQVVLNLLTNAVDAMPSGGSLRIATSREGEAAVLRVADSGPGIAPDSRDRIFEPFFTTKDSGGGTGLGLAVCRQIVDTHGGTIQVTDAPGGGAAFEVRLPLAAAEAVA